MQLSQKNSSSFSKLIARSLAWSSILVAVFSITFAFKETAHAGLFSVVSSLIGSEKASAKDKVPSYTINSQNIALLSAAANRDPNPDRNMEVYPLYGGETLVADLVLSNAVVDEGNNQISTYIIREGDTVSGVAEMFGVSINTILWANDLSSRSILRAGQTLVILPISGVNYTVKKGDTLESIAKRHNADTNEILIYNDLSLDSTLAVGQNIIIPHADLAVTSTSKAGSSGVSSTLSKKLPNLPGYFTRPVTSGIKTQKIHGHNGVDIAGPVGTPILASAAGTVIINRMNGAWNGGYGNYVVISHPNGTQTLYAHMLSSVVKVGEMVAKGEKIGAMGNTGLSTGPHLHFEIRGAVNPF